jgi:hypothetical protein
MDFPLLILNRYENRKPAVTPPARSRRGAFCPWFAAKINRKSRIISVRLAGIAVSRRNFRFGRQGRMTGESAIFRYSARRSDMRLGTAAAGLDNLQSGPLPRSTAAKAWRVGPRLNERIMDG